MTPVQVGTIVRFEAPGSRGTDGEPRIIPAIVTRVWPDSTLELYAFHFEGSFLVHSIAPEAVEIVTSQPLAETPLPLVGVRREIYTIDDAH